MCWHGALHPIPDGLVLGVPTGLAGWPAATAVVAGARRGPRSTPLLPRTALDADSLGALVRARFGAEVLERLVDPLVGSINAADTDRLSLGAGAAARRRRRAARSLLLGLAP